MILHSVVVTARRFIAIDGYDRALALAAKAFVAVVPLVLVLAAWAPAGARQRAGAALVEGMGLDGATAAVVRQLVARPPDASEPVTVVGLALLVFSVLGFARSLQRTFEAAWELPRSGLRGYGPGLLGASVFIGEVVALILLAEAVHSPSRSTSSWWPSCVLWWGRWRGGRCSGCSSTAGCRGATSCPAPSSPEWARPR